MWFSTGLCRNPSDQTPMWCVLYKAWRMCTIKAANGSEDNGTSGSVCIFMNSAAAIVSPNILTNHNDPCILKPSKHVLVKCLQIGIRFVQYNNWIVSTRYYIAMISSEQPTCTMSYHSEIWQYFGRVVFFFLLPNKIADEQTKYKPGTNWVRINRLCWKPCPLPHYLACTWLD